MNLAAYDTNTSYSTFFLSQIGQAALTSIASALLVVLAVVPGEPLYRELQPAKIRLGAGLRLPGMRTKEFFTANVIGICLAAAHIGYITVFYIVGGKLGVWAPQDLELLPDAGQHVSAVDLPSGDWNLCRHKRRVSVPALRHTFCAAHHQLEEFWRSCCPLSPGDFCTAITHKNRPTSAALKSA